MTLFPNPVPYISYSLKFLWHEIFMNSVKKFAFNREYHSLIFLGACLIREIENVKILF